MDGSCLDLGAVVFAINWVWRKMLDFGWSKWDADGSGPSANGARTGAAVRWRADLLVVAAGLDERGMGVMGLSPTVMGSAAMAAKRKWRRWVFDLFALCVLMLEEDGGIGFSVLSSLFWVAWIDPPDVQLELPTGSHGCRPW
ncbi:hypothetical protein ACLOJK_019541 [Asimina triloba]